MTILHNERHNFYLDEQYLPSQYEKKVSILLFRFWDMGHFHTLIYLIGVFKLSLFSHKTQIHHTVTSASIT